MNTIIFDLDGTLLPMNQDKFFKEYFRALAKNMSDHGYQPEELINTVWQGTKAMLSNKGVKSNEEVFWDCFASIHGEHSRKSVTAFEKFYEEEFDELKKFTSPIEEASFCIDMLKKKKYTLVLATNPLFPRVATHFRIKWAGINPEDFSYITTYENSSYSKPNLDYYREVLSKTSKQPEECMMIGNDLEEDMVIKDLGTETFLLTDCVVNYDEEKARGIKKGSYAELIKLISELPSL